MPFVEEGNTSISVSGMDGVLALTRALNNRARIIFGSTFPRWISQAPEKQDCAAPTISNGEQKWMVGAKDRRLLGLRKCRAFVHHRNCRGGGGLRPFFIDLDKRF